MRHYVWGNMSKSGKMRPFKAIKATVAKWPAFGYICACHIKMSKITKQKMLSMKIILMKMMSV